MKFSTRNRTAPPSAGSGFQCTYHFTQLSLYVSISLLCTYVCSKSHSHYYHLKGNEWWRKVFEKGDVVECVENNNAAIIYI